MFTKTKTVANPAYAVNTYSVTTPASPTPILIKAGLTGAAVSNAKTNTGSPTMDVPVYTASVPDA